MQRNVFALFGVVAVLLTRNGGADDFSRDAYRRRCWQFEMLRQRWNRKSVLNVASVVVQCESECRPLATKLVSASTSGAAQQNARTISPVTRSIGR